MNKEDELWQQINEIKEDVSPYAALTFIKENCFISPKEQAAEIQSLKQEITEANGILRSCNSIIERRGEKTNWLAIEYKIKERLKKQHEILKQQTHG